MYIIAIVGWSLSSLHFEDITCFMFIVAMARYWIFHKCFDDAFIYFDGALSTTALPSHKAVSSHKSDLSYNVGLTAVIGRGAA